MSNELEKPDMLRGQLVQVDDAVGSAFVTDACRQEEAIMTADDLKNKWEISDDMVAALARNDALTKAIRAELERRIYNGAAASDAAKFHFARAPHRLGHMLDDKLEASARKIDAAKELRAIARDGGAAEAASRDRFTIIIHTGPPEEPPEIIEVNHRPWLDPPAEDESQM